MLVSILVLLAAALQSVLADSDSCSNSATISSQSDANALGSCDQIDGSVVISSSASGSIILYNITEIKGSFTAEGAPSLTTLAAPALESVDGSFTIDNMKALSNLSMSALSKASSDITITNNPKLKVLEFQDLEEVDGNLKLTGSFTSVSLPSLDQVDGDTTIRGGSSMSCTALNSLKSDDNDVFKGNYSCSTSGSSLSAGEKAGIAVGVIILVVLLVLLVWYLLRQRRERMRRRRRDTQMSLPSPAPMLEKEKSFQPVYSSIPSHEPSLIKLPRKPLRPPPELLDGRSLYEATDPASPDTVYHELDAGPVFGRHQRPIHAGDVESPVNFGTSS